MLEPAGALATAGLKRYALSGRATEAMSGVVDATTQRNTFQGAGVVDLRCRSV